MAEQEARAKAFIISQGWKHAGTYSDVASGKDLNRPGLDNLLNNLNKIDFIVVLKLDRLSRKLLDILNLIYEKFDKNKTYVISVTETFNTSTHQGRLLLSMLGSFAEYERELIRERVMSGKRAKAQAGGYIGGSPRLGRKAVNRELVIDQEEMNLVRLIKYHRNQGKSLNQIADFLTEKGYKTKRGGKWYPKTVANVLK